MKLLNIKKIMKNKPHQITIVSLSLAFIALLLAIIPPHFIDNKIENLKPHYIEKDPTFSIEIKGFKLDIGNKKKIEKQIDNSSEIEKLQSYKENIYIVMLVFGILSVFTGIYSMIKEPSKKLSLASIATASAALLWQPFVEGIAMAVGVLVIILLIVSFGGLFS